MTLLEFTQSMGADEDERRADIQIGDNLFARIYADNSIYISDGDYHDYTLTIEQVESLWKWIDQN